MKKNLIDIIIPVYNINEYVNRCIDSVISIKKCNLIVIDDGSTQNTDFIEEKYSSFDNFSFYRKENGGLSSARNFGIEKALSDYIMFLDGDDFIDTNKMIDAIEFIIRTKEDAYYFSFIRYFQDSNKFEKENGIDSYFYKEYISVNDQDFIKEQFVNYAWRYIIKRDVIIENNLYFLEGIYHEDLDWTPRFICSVDKIYSLKEYLYYYRRQRIGAITNTYVEKNIFDKFIIIKSLNKYKESLNDISKINFINNNIISVFDGLVATSFWVKKPICLIKQKGFRKQFKEVQKLLVFNDRLIKKIIFKYGSFETNLLYIKSRNFLIRLGRK